MARQAPPIPCVAVEWSFCPTIRFKDRYGKYPLNKIARVAVFWSNQRQAPPTDVARAIEEYQQDKVPYEAQRAAAWRELIHDRLPEPPGPYFWSPQRREFVFDNTLLFRLWHQSLGYLPVSE